MIRCYSYEVLNRQKHPLEYSVYLLIGSLIVKINYWSFSSSSNWAFKIYLLGLAFLFCFSYLMEFFIMINSFTTMIFQHIDKDWSIDIQYLTYSTEKIFNSKIIQHTDISDPLIDLIRHRSVPHVSIELRKKRIFTWIYRRLEVNFDFTRVCFLWRIHGIF